MNEAEFRARSHMGAPPTSYAPPRQTVTGFPTALLTLFVIIAGGIIAQTKGLHKAFQGDPKPRSAPRSRSGLASEPSGHRFHGHRIRRRPEQRSGESVGLLGAALTLPRSAP